MLVSLYLLESLVGIPRLLELPVLLARS